MTDQTSGDLGTVFAERGQYVVRFERHLRHPREKVWRAITESEHLAHWLPCDIVGERRAGAAIELPFWPEHVERYDLGSMPTFEGTIEVWDPPAVFEWWWSTERLRWELDEIDGGTLLRFITWLSPDEEHGPSQKATGYHVCLAHLVELLDSGAPPRVDADPAALEASYAELVGAR